MDTNKFKQLLAMQARWLMAAEERNGYPPRELATSQEQNRSLWQRYEQARVQSDPFLAKLEKGALPDSELDAAHAAFREAAEATEAIVATLAANRRQQ
ncbi:MAG TPA: hypothetical protein VD907_04585 [Verrucomicrobiae bacterium]|nr:hypothetical protein [Verrucomicrobiae bacterium]